MNIWCATGRTTDSVELRYTQDQKAVGDFTLAVDDGFGEKKKTHFFSCTVFGATAESLEKYCQKGTKIAVTGRPTQNKWKDKEGNNRSTVNFIVDRWEFAKSAEKTGKKPQEAPQDGFTDDLDGLPFN